jgi:DNA-binding winged helix-turn-helix (wHTH) protein/tetratricopeptide (TPR) repeat protein
MDAKVKRSELTSATPQPGLWKFDEYRIDPARRLLSFRGKPVEITGKPFDALVLLVLRAGQVVSRRDMVDALWPSTVVEDNNLSQVVLALRRALDDIHDVPRFIASVPRRGYQFIGNVQQLPAARRPWTARSTVVLGATIVIGVALALVAWLARPRAAVEAAACSASSSLEASSWCRQALDLYATNGGIGVSVPGEPRAQIVQRLDQAIELDPEFPEALGWRAHFQLDALMFDPLPAGNWQRARAEGVQRVERDAIRALLLDPRQQMAQVTLARLDMYHWRLAEALTRLGAARRQHPGSTVVEHYLAMIAVLMGDFPRAIRESQRALEIDSRNPAPYSPLVLALVAQNDRERALLAARGMIERAPNAPIGYINLGRVLAGGADAPPILEAARLAEQRIAGRTPNFRLDAALLYARAGEHTAAQRLVSEFNRTSTAWHADPGVAAMANLAQRDYAGARRNIIKALAERGRGADPMPLLLIRENSWNDPELDKQEWRDLRRQLAYSASAHVY